MLFVKYLYYKLYRFATRGRVTIGASISSVATVCVLLFFNIITIQDIYYSYFTYLFGVSYDNLFIAIAILIYLLLVIYFFFLGGESKAQEQFKNESKKKSRQGSYFIIAYIILTIIIFCFSIIILGKSGLGEREGIYVQRKNIEEKH